MNENPENLLKELYDNQQFEQIISYCNEQIEGRATKSTMHICTIAINLYKKSGKYFGE